MNFSLSDHIDAVKVELAHCQDVDEAARLFRECREALQEMLHLTDLAGAVCDKLTTRTLPESWRPFVVARNERRH